MNNRNYYAADKEYLSDEEIEEVFYHSITLHNRIYHFFNIISNPLIIIFINTTFIC